MFKSCIVRVLVEQAEAKKPRASLFKQVYRRFVFQWCIYAGEPQVKLKNCFN